MDAETISKLALAALPVLGGGLQIARGRRGARRQIKDDLELLALMPENTDVRATMLEHLNQQVSQLITIDDERRRDPFGIGMALLFLTAAAGTASLAILSSNWWWAGAFALAFIGVVGLGTSLPKRKRDEKGRRLGAAPPHSRQPKDEPGSQDHPDTP